MEEVWGKVGETVWLCMGRFGYRHEREMGSQLEKESGTQRRVWHGTGKAEMVAFGDSKRRG